MSRYWIVILSTLLVGWLTALTVAVYVHSKLINFNIDRMTNVEFAAPEEWECDHTTKQQVYLLTPNSGAFPASMDVCDRWKAKR